MLGEVKPQLADTKFTLRFNVTTKTRLVEITKTDKILLDLNRTVPEYIKSVGQFQYENDTYRLIRHSVSPKYMKCDICASFPIVVIFMIETKGKKLNVCSKCIDRITNHKISKWFKNYRQKRKNTIRNRKYIDGIALILAAYKNNELLIQIPKMDIERLQKMFQRMCDGLNPTAKQEQLAKYYVSKTAQAQKK